MEGFFLCREVSYTFFLLLCVCMSNFTLLHSFRNFKISTAQIGQHSHFLKREITSVRNSHAVLI